MLVCEARIPTYKRPDLLTRALSSLLDQTHEEWRAIVLDDSPAQEAKEVVKMFDDRRIIYKPHEKNLGVAKNIDHAFSSSAYFDGDCAFVLEDDNYLYPDFIAENIRSMKDEKVNIVLRNQEVKLEKDGASLTTGRTTRSRWFDQGVYQPLELYARIFFCEGISNGGLFWNTKQIKSNLQVTHQLYDSWHQELLRTVQIKEPISFGDEPLCVFTEFADKVKTPRPAPIHNRGTQAILIYLVQQHGEALIKEAQKVAVYGDAEQILERKLLDTFYLNYRFQAFNPIEAATILLKSSIRYLLFRNPLREVLSGYS